MQHDIPIDSYGAFGLPMADAVESCVHCGFCLSACPTYLVLGEEMDSPRGRIILMKETLEGNLSLEDSLPYIDRCLGCLACVTACPSGVQYGDLLTPFRAIAEEKRERSADDKALRRLVLETLPYPNRFRAAARMGQIGQTFRDFMPGRLGAMVDLIPHSLPDAPPLPKVFPAQGTRRARVALLAGCAQRVLEPDINWATLRVLSRNGVEVVIPKAQGCCGALAAHTGAMVNAQDFARKNLEVFPSDVDAIITNAAGCGSGMHEYGLWFKGLPEEEAAHAFSKRVKDISVFLIELGIVPPEGLAKPLTVAYHDACHLAHAQGVTQEPRALLWQIPNLRLVEIPEGEICCGSAGTYNLEQPTIAAALGERKAQNVLATGAEMVVSGNIGCLTQLGTHLRKLEKALPVLHTVQLLDRAYRQAEL